MDALDLCLILFLDCERLYNISDCSKLFTFATNYIVVELLHTI